MVGADKTGKIGEGRQERDTLRMYAIRSVFFLTFQWFVNFESVMEAKIQKRDFVNVSTSGVRQGDKYIRPAAGFII